MNKLLHWFQNLPRAAKWGVAAIAALGAYFLVIEPVLDRTNIHQSHADRLESELTRVAELESPDSADGAFLRKGRRVYGAPQLPTDAGSRPDAIHRIVDGVLEDHGIADRTKTERSVELSAERSAAILGGDGRVTRYIVEVSFEAPQETVVQIIADLEQSSVVTAISRVRIDRATGYSSAFARDLSRSDSSASRLVKATIAAEAWVRSASRGGSSDTVGGAS